MSGSVTACTSDAKPAGPTWYRDVQPIVQARCASCHDAGGPGPVNLTFPADDSALYEKSRSEFPSIIAAVDAEEMPYWLADSACGHYLHERRLSADEIHTFDAWFGAGAQRGDPNEAPAPPRPDPLARVDLRLTVDPGYTPKNLQALQDYRCFVLDPGLSAARDVVGFQFLPGSRRAQHAALYAAPLSAVQSLDRADDEVGYPCFADVGAEATLVGESVPGVQAQEYPAGTGIRLPAGIGLVLQIHYNLATGPAEQDRSQVELELASEPVPHPARFEPVQNDTFSIPAKAMAFSASASFRATRAATLYGAAPHLLAYGRAARVALTRAAGEYCLLNLSYWDRLWEQAYFFSNPRSFSVAPGDSIGLTCTWDNSTTEVVTPGSASSNEACVGNAYLADD